MRPGPDRRASDHTLGLLIVGSAVTILSVDSLLVTMLAQTMPVPAVIFWRGVGTTLGFSLIAWLVSRSGVRRAFGVLGADGLRIAVLNFLGSTLFVISVTHTTVAHALVIIAAAPIVTVILARLILHERARRVTWVASLVIAGGVALLFVAVPTAGNLVGDLSAVAATIVLSLNLIAMRKARLRNMIPALAIGGAITALACAPFVTRFSLSPREALLATAGGVIVLPVSLSLLLRGPRYLQAAEVGLVVLLESVLGPLWVLLGLHQVPDVRTLLSGAIILGAVATNTVLGRPRQA